MSSVESLEIIGTIAASVLSSSGLAWKITKFYVLKEVKEPMGRMDKRINLLKSEIDMMKMELKACHQTTNETQKVLVELSTKLNYITESLSSLTREVMALIKHN